MLDRLWTVYSKMTLKMVFEIFFKQFSKLSFHLCRKQGIEVRVVKRGEYNEDTVRWADAIISAGGKAQVFGFYS